MFWFGFVDENLDATVKIGRNQHVTATSFGMLLHNRIVHFVVLRLVVRPKPQLVLLQHFNDGGGVGGEHCAGHDGVVRLDRLPKIVTIAAHGRKLGVIVVRVPNVDVAVFRTAHNVFTVVAKASFDLTAHIHVTFSLVFTRNVQIAQVVQSNAAVV